jgi:hypothetical protein
MVVTLWSGLWLRGRVRATSTRRVRQGQGVWVSADERDGRPRTDREHTASGERLGRQRPTVDRLAVCVEELYLDDLGTSDPVAPYADPFVRSARIGTKAPLREQAYGACGGV